MARTVSLDLLKTIQVASPCAADWDQMTGDDRSRFCGQCQLNVYNIASLTTDEAVNLIREREGRVCIRLYRRSDGTVLTQDCPVGVRALAIKTAKALGRIAAAAGLLITGGLVAAPGSRESRMPRLRFLQPFPTIRQWLSPQVPVARTPVLPQIEMGVMICPVPTPQPAPLGSVPVR